MTKMTKTEMKLEAQDKLMSAMVVAFYTVQDESSADYAPDDADRERLCEEMSKQMARIERLFNYEPFSWSRG